MKSMTVPSKLEADAELKVDTAKYLAKGGRVTYLTPGDYTPIALKIYNPHVEYPDTPKKRAKYLDEPLT